MQSAEGSMHNAGPPNQICGVMPQRCNNIMYTQLYCDAILSSLKNINVSRGQFKLGFKNWLFVQACSYTRHLWELLFKQRFTNARIDWLINIVD